MIGFEWPWLALLLPLPYFVYRYARPLECRNRLRIAGAVPG